jgi:hypothetical protein
VSLHLYSPALGVKRLGQLLAVARDASDKCLDLGATAKQDSQRPHQGPVPTKEGERLPYGVHHGSPRQEQRPGAETEGTCSVRSIYSGECVGGLGSPRSGAIGKPVKTEVIVKGEPKDPGQGDDREERRRRDPAGFDLAERLDRDASCRRHLTQACRPACITQNGTEAPTAFDLPGLQPVSNHARMIIPV